MIDSLSFFPEQFDKIVDPLISFMTEEYQIKEYIDSVIRILRVYIDIVPHAFDLLLEKIGFQYEFFFGAKITIDTKNRGILYTD